MYLVNLLKVGLVKIADKYTELTSPYDEFTRLASPVIQTPIDQEAAFFSDLIQNFRVVTNDTTIVWNYKRNADGSFDLGDQALWHGITVFMLCLKYSQAPSTELENLIVRSANGMFLHQRTNWEIPRLVRGVKDSLGREYQDDASNDTLTGHLLGIYGLLKYGPKTSRAQGVTLSRNIANSLISHNYSLTNADGSPTTYGRLEHGVLTDALNLSLLLTALKMASSTLSFMCDDYEKPYQELVAKYKRIIPYGHVTLNTLRHDYDAHRPAVCYSILADLEKDHDVSRLYVKGLMRSWKRERKSRNPWIYYLMRRVMLMDPSDKDGCLIRLNEMDLSYKSPVLERKNSAYENEWKEQGIRFFQYGGHLRASQPLPLWMIGSQDFFWQRCQYSVDDWLGSVPPANEFHNGLDYLVAYWGFKELKFL